MARRIGAETVEQWSLGPEQFGQEREAIKVATYQGCWMGYGSTDEGVNSNPSVVSLVSQIWVPEEVEILDADDYFIWTRRPDEKYRTSGDVGRYYDRRGNLRANVVPVEVAK